MHNKYILFLVLILIHTHSRVIEITTNNVQLLLKTTPYILLLLHNPHCPYSKTYASQFLEVKNEYQMGIADCQKQKSLCSHFNISRFPTLIKLTNNSLSILDEQQFLVSQGLITKDDPKVILNQIISTLKHEGGYAVVILEEEGLPTLDKIEEAQEKSIFYIESPSKLHKFLFNFVGKKIGCWIAKLNAGNIQKYYCGNGYRSQQVLKNLQSFKKGRLIRYISTKQGDASSLQYAELNQMIKDLGRNYEKCRIVYFYSKECEHCNVKDVEKINNVLTELNINKHFSLQMYNLDIEQVPANLAIRRIPQLLEFCQTQLSYFGQIFDQSSLRSFLSRKRASKVTVAQNADQESQVKKLQQGSQVVGEQI